MARAKPGTKRKKAGRGVRKVTAEARPRAKAVRKPARKAASRRAKPIRAPAPLLVTARNLSVVSFEPLHPEATAAFAAGDRVQLLVGRGEDGALVETLVFEPAGRLRPPRGVERDPDPDRPGPYARPRRALLLPRLRDGGRLHGGRRRVAPPDPEGACLQKLLGGATICPI
jgi:hypothetical protein